MNWKLKDDSLFAILLRSPWWVSIAVGGALGAIAVAFLPLEYRVVGAITGVPFFVIGGIALWRHWQAPSASRIADTLVAVRAMSWPEFSRAIEDAYRRQGYRVDEVAEGAALKVEAHGLTLAVFNVDGRHYVTDDLCTHGPGSLSEGYVEGDVVECNFHNGQFNIRTGEVVSPPCMIPIKTYPTTVENGKVVIEI